MKSQAFHKLHGLGNDFIVVESESLEHWTPERARELCRRHFGIGADGLLVVLPSSTAGARARMVVLNADGSRPEMCGNGLRCVALHLARKDSLAEARYRVETDAGLLGCVVARSGNVGEVEVELGRASLLDPLRFESAQGSLEFLRISMGNPHAVCFGAPWPVEEIDRVAPRISAQIEGGANVEFASPRACGGFDLVVWERGVGRTLACGTGAGATAVAAIRAGLAPAHEPVSLTLPGGPLSISVSTNWEVRLRGPAIRVFSGELPCR